RTASTIRAAPNEGHIAKGRRGGKGSRGFGRVVWVSILGARTALDRSRAMVKDRNSGGVYRRSAYGRRDESDAKVFEMPLIGRNDRQAMYGGGRRDRCVFKTGRGSPGYRAVEQASGLKCGVRSERQCSGLIKFENRAEPMGQVGGPSCGPLALESGNASLDLA